MNTEISKMHAIWNIKGVISESKIELPALNLEELVGNVFSSGPTYYYIIDFSDKSISNVSQSIKDIHGFDPQSVTLDDILSIIHPDDMDHVAKAEYFCARSFFENHILWQKATTYKVCYSFRFKVTDGSYRLFLHQALTLGVDDQGKTARSLNIHTDISHFASKNNYTVSFIGLRGEPSYFNLSYDHFDLENKKHIFSNREVEIISLLAEGLSSVEIANKLHISNETVRNHRKNILEKADCKNMVQLVRKMTLIGLI